MNTIVSQIKDFLHNKSELSLDEILEEYISYGSFFDFFNLEEAGWTYLKIKNASDDYSGDEEYEILSFDLNLSDGTILELKLYYKEKLYFGDAICIYNNQLNMYRFEKILKKKIMKYNVYMHNTVDDEGVILLENRVIARFKLENKNKIIYQIEGNFLLYPDFSSAREKNIKDQFNLL